MLYNTQILIRVSMEEGGKLRPNESTAYPFVIKHFMCCMARYRTRKLQCAIFFSLINMNC